MPDATPRALSDITNPDELRRQLDDVDHVEAMRDGLLAAVAQIVRDALGTHRPMNLDSAFDTSQLVTLRVLSDGLDASDCFLVEHGLSDVPSHRRGDTAEVRKRLREEVAGR